MLRNNRILYKPSDDAFQDFSQALSDISAGTKVFAYEAGEYLYLGSDLPFNHRHFEISVVNAIAATVTVEIWTGTEWQECVDVIDDTANAAGVPFAQSGIISWQPDLDEDSWSKDDTYEMEGSGLEESDGAPKIFGLYWVRMSWSEDLTGTTAFEYIGHKFSNDTQLEAEYPTLAQASIKTAFESGKTNWNEQHLKAAEYIIADLRGEKAVAVSGNQILQWERYQNASVHRVAAMAFKAFGEDYVDEFAQAIKDYKSAMAVGYHELDLNKNATLDEGEKFVTQREMTR